LLGAELPLNPAIEIVNAIRMQSDWGQDLKFVSTIVILERDPSLGSKAKTFLIEADYI
jgi:hypothetical protein